MNCSVCTSSLSNLDISFFYHWSQIAEQRKNAEDELAMFVERRIRWFEELNAHLASIPVKNNSSGQKPNTSEKVILSNNFYFLFCVSSVI